MADGFDIHDFAKATDMYDLSGWMELPDMNATNNYLSNFIFDYLSFKCLHVHAGNSSERQCCWLNIEISSSRGKILLIAMLEREKDVVYHTQRYYFIALKDLLLLPLIFLN